MRPVDYLEELGWLGDDVWLAHCVHLDEADQLASRIAVIVATAVPVAALRLMAAILAARCAVPILPAPALADRQPFVAWVAKVAVIL